MPVGICYQSLHSAGLCRVANNRLDPLKQPIASRLNTANVIIFVACAADVGLCGIMGAELGMVSVRKAS